MIRSAGETPVAVVGNGCVRLELGTQKAVEKWAAEEGHETPRRAGQLSLGTVPSQRACECSAWTEVGRWVGDGG